MTSHDVITGGSSLCRSRDRRKGARGGDREGAVDARDGAEPNKRRTGPYGHRSHWRRDFPRRRTEVNDGRAEEREGRGPGGEAAHQRRRNVRRRPDGDGNLPNSGGRSSGRWPDSVDWPREGPEQGAQRQPEQERATAGGAAEAGAWRRQRILAGLRRPEQFRGGDRFVLSEETPAV